MIDSKSRLRRTVVYITHVRINCTLWRNLIQCVMYEETHWRYWHSEYICSHCSPIHNSFVNKSCGWPQEQWHYFVIVHSLYSLYEESTKRCYACSHLYPFRIKCFNYSKILHYKLSATSPWTALIRAKFSHPATLSTQVTQKGNINYT